MEELSVEGFWHVPEDPDDKVPGTLHFHPQNGITIELFKTFDAYPYEGQWLFDQPDIEVIHGSTKTNADLTVVDCSIRSSQGVKEGDGSHIKHVPTYECSQIFFSDALVKKIVDTD